MHDAPLPGGIDERTVFRSLFTASPDALLLVDAAGLILLANPAAASLLGYPLDELVGSSVDALVPDSIRPRHAAYRQAYGQAPRVRPMGTHMELVAKRRDGSEVMVEIALSPLQNQGQPLVVAAIRDIGAYPRVKQALQRARYAEHLAQIGRIAVDARDPQLLLQQVPAFAAAALEVDEARVHLLAANGLEFRVASAIGTELRSPLEEARTPNRADSGPGFVLAQGHPVLMPQCDLAGGLVSAFGVPLIDRGRFIGVLEVCSRQPKNYGEDELRFLEAMATLLASCLQRAQTEEALKHAQRLESVGQLTGGIAHDFNNLLTVIQGNLQVVDELPALADDALGRQLVAAALRATRRGAELTGKLLAFSRRQVLQPSVVDVDELLASLADMLRRTLDQRVKISVEVQPSCPPVLADAGQLEAALLNIAINARDAMPEGGHLRFVASCGPVPDDPQLPDSRLVCIAISDDGAGMAEDVKERAFEPFFTTKPVGRGTGLGLSTVYGFATQSRGAVTIVSAPGQGTTIRLYLPPPSDQSALLPDNEVDGKAGRATIAPGLRVLLVEDDAEVRAVARQFLDTLGCVVTPCANAEQALPLLAPGAPFDLLLSDIALGAGMRGTELAQIAQASLPSIAILLVSGFSAELLDADRDSPRSWELLPKPYSREQLAQAMARVMAN